MAFCDALLWNHLYQSAAVALKEEEVKLGDEEERKAAVSLLADDGLGETWKSLPLSASWSFWKDLTKPHNKVGMKTQDFAKHLQETGHFKTIAALDDIWQARTRNLRMFSNLRIFRDPIKPLWEVPQNREGGKFVIILNKSEGDAKTSPTEASPSSSTKSGAVGSSHNSDDDEDDLSQQQSSKSGTNSEKPSVDVPLEYKLCLSLMVLGLLGPTDQFCGCVLSIRAFGHMISIWVSSSTNDTFIGLIRHNISLLLGVSLDSITFQRHNESIRNNSRNLSKTETRKRMREARAKGDLIDAPQQQRPPRRKSESEKPENTVWGAPIGEYVKRPAGENAATAHSTSTKSASTSSPPSQPQYPRDMNRSLSGGRLNVHSLDTASASASNTSSTSQQYYTHGSQSTHAHHGPRSPTSPRGSSNQGPVSPRSAASAASGGHTPHSLPSTPSGAHTTRADPNYSEPSKTGAKASAGKRGMPYQREKVTFQESVEIQHIYPHDAPGHGRGHVEKARVHPPAPWSIPNINVTSGTPPPGYSPLQQAMEDQNGGADGFKTSGAHSAAASTYGSTSGRGQGNASTANGGDDDEGWTMVGKPSTSNRGSNDSKSAAARGKRRTQSASAGPGQKPDPNYISPEALFGADLPLASPSITPRDSVPPSPPTELDDEDLIFLEEQRRLRLQQAEHNVQHLDLSDRLQQLSERHTSYTYHSTPSSHNDATQQGGSAAQPSAQSQISPRGQHLSSHSRRAKNKRRKSTTDSETQPYNTPPSNKSTTGSETTTPSAVNTTTTRPH